MKNEKIREAYDSFRLDDQTRQAALENILEASRQERTASAGKRKRRIRRLTAAAACAVLLLGFGTAAYALGWFGLRDLSVGKDDHEVTRYRYPDGEPYQKMVESEILSLGGYTGTPEYEAFAEWDAYRRSYVEAHRDELTNEVTAPNGYYDTYFCCFPEMEEKLDEILEKYGLKPVENEQDFEGASLQDVCDAAGIGSILPDRADTVWEAGCYAYVFDNGSFHLETSLYTGEEELLDFSLNRAVYGSLYPYGINIRDAERFTEWQFTTEEGVPVTVAEIREPFTDAYGQNCAPTALVLIGRPESMVTIGISPREQAYYLIDGVRYKDEELPEGVIGTPESHHWEYELPSREEIRDFVEDLHPEQIP